MTVLLEEMGGRDRRMHSLACAEGNNGKRLFQTRSEERP